MQIIDIIFIVLIVILVIRCSLRGFIVEVMSMAAVVLGFLAALLLYSSGGVYIREKFMPDMRVLSEILAFVVLFLVVFILVKIVESILKGIIEGIHLGGLDRFLGIFFGLLEGLVVTGLILLVLAIQPLFDSREILGRSFFAEMLLPFIRRGGEGSTGNGIVASLAVMLFPAGFHV